MGTYKVLRIVFIFFVLGQVAAQDKTEAVQTSFESLLHSKNFEFIANTAIPQTGAPRNLAGSNYSIIFTPETVISNLPFYGRAYSGMVLGRDKGMRFTGKPENFKVTNTKNGYGISVSVTGKNDTYFISISTGSSGFATLSISSNDRGTISYKGEIIGK